MFIFSFISCHTKGDQIPTQPSAIPQVDTINSKDNSHKEQNNKKKPEQVGLISICDRGIVGEEIAKALKAENCQKVPAEKISTLKTLNLRNKSLSIIREKYFKGLNALEVLDLSSDLTISDNKKTNNIIVISQNAFKDLANLKILYLSNNLLADVPKNTFHDLLKLETLDLSGNQIKLISTDSFKDLNELESLNLSANLIEAFASDAFNGLSKLKNLNLSKNKITSISTNLFQDLKSLKEIHLDENKLNILSRSNLGLSENTKIYGVTKVIP